MAMKLDKAEMRIDPDEVREALRLIGESGALGEGKLLLLFDYLINEELAGRGDRLKGYSIALDVFDRGADFDPSIDSVVRVEMLRLRKALASYYARGETGSRVVIALTKGSYRPTFSHAPDPAPATEGPPKAGRIAGVKRAVYVYGGIAALILVALALSSSAILNSFGHDDDYHCSRPALALRVNGFSRVRQAQFQGIFSKILQAYPLVLTGTAPKSCPAMQRRLELTQIAGNSMQAALYRNAERHPYWAQAFVADSGDSELLMAQILYRVASREGALVQDMLRSAWTSDKAMRDYACHVRSYSHFVNPTTDNPADDVACLRASMKANSHFSDTYSTYAVFMQLRYFDPVLYGKVDRKPLLADYHWAMSRALTIDPTDCLAMVARLREYRRAVPTDHERLGETVNTIKRYCASNPFMSSHIAMVEGYVFDNWVESRRLLERTVAISGMKPWYSHSLLGNLMMMGRWKEAHDTLETLGSTLNPTDAIWLVIVGNRAGDREMVSRGVKYLDARAIRSYNDIEKYFTAAGFHSDVIERMLDELAPTFPPPTATIKRDAEKIPVATRG